MATTSDSSAHGPTFDVSAPAIAPTAEFMQAAEAAGLQLDAGELDRLARYLGYLVDANRRFNLTAAAEPSVMWLRHILDSLTLLPVIVGLDRPEDRSGPLRLLDLGSGGGLPGIPLAITLPQVQVTLLEATGKKARFLGEVVAALGLPNVVVVQDRAEEIGRDRERHREGYDVVTCRAVAALSAVVELAVPLACVGGVVLAIKGERAPEEIAQAKVALHALHAHVLEPIRTGSGTIVPVQKMRTTPKLYPRRPGEPQRAPLA